MGQGYRGMGRMLRFSGTGDLWMSKKCCEKYKKGKKACKDCPVMEGLNKRQRHKLIRKHRKKK
jgi:hypothetical protein